jgi:predicted HicB family RNase H-like nuclease
VRLILPRKLKRLLEEKAKKEGVTVNDLIILALAKIIEEEARSGA